MSGNMLAKSRAFLLRSLAVMAVVLTYAVGTVGTHVAAVVGISSLALTATATSAQAQYRFRRRRFVRVVPRRRVVRRAFVPRRRFVRRRWW